MLSPFFVVGSPMTSGGMRRGKLSVANERADRFCTRMASHPAREPIFNLPAATLALTVAIVGIQFLRGFLSDGANLGLVIDWGFIPLRLPLFWAPDQTMEELRQIAEATAHLPPDSPAWFQGVIAGHVMEEGSSRIQTLITYAFLHGGWTHVIVNALWLVAFGGAVDRRFGAARYLLLGAVSAVAGALAHMAIEPQSPLPLIGASGVVSGYTGAMARFAFATGGPLGRWRAPGDDSFRYPAAPLADFFRNRRALIFVGLWFGLNIITGVAALPLGVSEGPVAWMAHFGGFAAGFLLFGLFDPIGRIPPSDLR